MLGSDSLGWKRFQRSGKYFSSITFSGLPSIRWVITCTTHTFQLNKFGINLSKKIHLWRTASTKQQQRNPSVVMFAYISCSADLCSQYVSSTHPEYIYECIPACCFYSCNTLVFFFSQPQVPAFYTEVIIFSSLFITHFHNDCKTSFTKKYA
jgi:hypothetical protein